MFIQGVNSDKQSWNKSYREFLDFPSKGGVQSHVLKQRGPETNAQTRLLSLTVFLERKTMRKSSTLDCENEVIHTELKIKTCVFVERKQKIWKTSSCCATLKRSEKPLRWLTHHSRGEFKVKHTQSESINLRHLSLGCILWPRVCDPGANQWASPYKTWK